MTDNETFVLQHREDDVRRLALGRVPDGVDLRWCLQQIEGWQLARKKLPHWADTDGVWFPPRLSMEQCSSQLTAEYKAKCTVSSRNSFSEKLDGIGVFTSSIPSSQMPLLGTFVDLTGGFGVDFSFMARRFQYAVYVEQNEVLCDIARHNFSLLSLPHAEVCCSTAEAWLDEALDAPNDGPVTLFLDPARRDDVGRKVVALEDCSPNVIALHDSLLSVADTVIIKLSPMLDIKQALRQLSNVAEVHVVSLQGECKELLLVLRRQKADVIRYCCVNLGTNDEMFQATFPLSSYSSAFSPLKPQLFEDADNNALVGRLLFEPNASVLKAGVQDGVCERYALLKLHTNSNLFVSAMAADDMSSERVVAWPGRCFRIVGLSDFSKQGLRALLSGVKQANLTVRNFPNTVAELRKRLRLKEGGSVYLFATTLADGQHVLLKTEKLFVNP